MHCTVRGVRAIVGMMLCLWAMMPGCGSSVITSYLSEILLHVDNTIQVEETISFTGMDGSTFEQLVRSISRFTRDERGMARPIRITQCEALFDGIPIPVTMGRNSNHLELRADDTHTSGLPAPTPGEHVYVLRYSIIWPIVADIARETMRWEMVGEGWGVPISSFSAQVHLPDGVAVTAVNGSAFLQNVSAGTKRLVFRLPAGTALPMHQNVPISISFPRNSFSMPTWNQTIIEWGTAYLSSVAALICIILLLLYYRILMVRPSDDLRILGQVSMPLMSMGMLVSVYFSDLELARFSFTHFNPLQAVFFCFIGIFFVAFCNLATLRPLTDPYHFTGMVRAWRSGQVVKAGKQEPWQEASPTPHVILLLIGASLICSGSFAYLCYLYTAYVISNMIDRRMEQVGKPAFSAPIIIRKRKGKSSTHAS